MDLIVKHSEEYFPIHANFGNDLVFGETVSSYSVSCIKRETGENTLADVVAADSLSSPDINLNIRNGTDQDVHIITVLGTTSLGNVYKRVILVYIIDDPSQDIFDKTSEEKAVVMVDFTGELETSDTVSSALVTVTSNLDGIVYTTTILVSTTVVTPKVYFKIQAGVAGSDYTLKVKATSASGYKYVRLITMRVRDI